MTCLFGCQNAAENLRLSDAVPDEQLSTNRSTVAGDASSLEMNTEKDEKFNEKLSSTKVEDIGGIKADGNRSDSPVRAPFCSFLSMPFSPCFRYFS